ncbi:MAG: tRNA glutamyl-Q(34) synthetase GluQRS [Deltaproteobacteria bacterium]|nr:tRNA glutamyl-Q(34) synthetase GluQRS [Deltaproteobacteria bacterium]
MDVRGRFAPSPTGELHVGNARTALLAWLQVRALGGKFVMRVEDLDPARAVKGSMERQLHALKALGIDWDEGPDVGGPFAPYVQSERLEIYRDAIAKLRAAGRIYPCYCSRAEIARIAHAPHAGDEGPRYPGTCRDLSEAERKEREASGRKPSLRFRVEPGEVEFVDLLAGRYVQNVDEVVGDFVVQRADGVFAYQLAVVVDDAAMGITHVLRGDDLLASAPRQIQLYRALGAAPPEFAHVGLVVGPTGERLSKRDGPVSVSAMLDQGADPSRIRRELCAMSGVSGEPASFRIDQVVRGPVRWHPDGATSS